MSRTSFSTQSIRCLTCSRSRKVALFLILGAALLYQLYGPWLRYSFFTTWGDSYLPRAEADSVRGREYATALIEAAREQIGRTVYYDSAYTSLKYPDGDVPIERGVCTDVLIRAYRELGVDLQVLVHEDMKSNFSRYPRLWGLSTPNRNIDHRRVPNLMTYLQRHGVPLPIFETAADYSPGSIIVWYLGGGRSHIGLVVDREGGVIHNIGQGTRYERVLFNWKILGHFELDPGNQALGSLHNIQ